MKSGGMAASGLLAAVTLTTFAVLRDYGPESAIRRFHEAIENGDARQLQAVSAQQVTPRIVRLLGDYQTAVQTANVPLLGATVDASASQTDLERLVRRTMLVTASETTYRIGRMDRSPSQVRAALVYKFPNGRPSAMIWVITRTGPVWRVDARQTVTIIRDGIGF